MYKKCHFQKTALRTGHFELFLINCRKTADEKKKKILIKNLENFIRNILQPSISIYNFTRKHSDQNHRLVHFDASCPGHVATNQFKIGL